MTKDKNATLLGKRGGQVSTSKLTPTQITNKARKMARARWDKTTPRKRKAIMAKVRDGKQSSAK